MRIKGLPARRSVLAGAVVLAAGCTGTDTTEYGGDPRHLGRLRRRAARDSRELLRRYDATATAHPDLAGALEPLRAEVARHVAALHDGREPGEPSVHAKPRPPRPPEASGSPGSPAGPEPAAPESRADAAGRAAPDVPQDRGAALAELAAAEKRTADAHTAALAEAPGDLARLLASVAAAGAAHVYLLTDANAVRPG